MKTLNRQAVEKKIVRKLVADILTAGYRIGVSLDRGYDVDEMLLGSTDKAKIMKEAFAGDECHIFIQPATGPLIENGYVVSNGWVYLVFGNDGWDVVNDYTTNLETLMAGANELADKYSEVA